MATAAAAAGQSAIKQGMSYKGAAAVHGKANSGRHQSDTD